MAAALPTADDVLAVVKTLIVELGTDAFHTEGRVLLYSGPGDGVAATLTVTRRNRARARIQARRSHFAMIDHTRVGQYLGKINYSGNVYKYFAKKYARRYGDDSEEAFAEADKVMRVASREFMKASFGHVATAVCGAATDRIFYEVELPAMVENKAIETINGLPAELVRDFCRLDLYEAFRLICLAELLEARRYAKVAKPSRLKQQAKRDYRERLGFFVRERRTTSHRPRATADEAAHLKLAKKRIVARYKIMEDMSAIIDVEPLLPPAAMPMRRAHAGMPHGIA